MSERVGTATEGGTHGFLFADLRGYTQLVDTRGAIAASQLLERYRAIVREVVARDGGAEIKTEGDSFYVVLPSASMALRCGMDILSACRQPPDGGSAIAVGLGIHAGESVAHEGGFVGSAVNIAARICALAGPGELLASGTIRELTRSIVAADFVPVGRRQLKGLAEPVELFRVEAEGAMQVTGRPRAGLARQRPAPWLIVSAVAIVVVAAGAVIAADGGLLPGAGSPTSPLPSSTTAVRPWPGDGLVLIPGTYAPTKNRDVASVTISERGWQAVADNEDLLFLGYGLGAGVGVARISVVYTGPCSVDPTRVIGDRPSDLIAWIQSTPQLEALEPRSVVDLGRSGIAIDATVLPHPSGPCGTTVKGPSYLWGISGGAWSPNTGDRILFEALEDGTRTLIVVYAANDAALLADIEDGHGPTLLAGIMLRP